MKKIKFSVLMSIYKNDKVSEVRVAIDSLLNQKTFCFIPGSPFIQFFPHVFVPRKLFKDELLFAKNAQG